MAHRLIPVLRLFVVVVVIPLNCAAVLLTVGAAQDLPQRKPPPGFEFVDEPQQTTVVVYYDNQPVTQVAVTFTSSWVEIADPDLLVAAIDNIEYKAPVIAALKRRLSSHAELICPDKNPPVCQFPPTEVASVVFDSNLFRFDLFINPSYLKKTPAKSFLLPPSTAGLSLVNTVNLQLSGNHGDSNISNNLINSGKIAFQSTRLNYNTSYTANSVTDNSTAFRVTELNQEWEKERWSSKIGLINTVGNTFVSNQSIAGFSVGTTLDTLPIDSRNAVSGSTINELLSLPSQVAVFRDGRLISSRFYPAGEQAIDTSEFPDGAYEVTLKISDNLGGTREEKKYFVKTRNIPPKDFPVYYLTAGYLKDSANIYNPLPTISTIAVVQAGIQKRIRDNVGISTDLITSSSKGFFTNSVLVKYSRVDVTTGFLLGSDRDYGISEAVSYTANYFNMNVGGQKIWGRATRDIATDTAATQEFDPVTQTSEDYYLNLGFNTLSRTTINLGARLSKSESSGIDRNYTASSSTQLYQNQSMDLSFELSAARGIDTGNVLFTATLQLRQYTKNFNNSVSAGFRNSDGNKGSFAEISSDWDNYDDAGDGLSLSGDASVDAGRETYTGSLDNSSHYGRYGFSVQQSRGNGDPSATQYSGFASTAVVWTKESISLGNTGFENSGVIVKLIDQDSHGDEAFNILNDAAVAKVVTVNTSTVVPLASYRAYSLKLQNNSKDFYRFDLRPMNVVVYPGNFQYIEWQLHKIKLLFARIITAPDTPLAFAYVKEENTNNFTDKFGFIQLEIISGQQIVKFQKGDKVCTVTLPKSIEFNGNFASLDEDLLCVPEQLTSLPINQQLTNNKEHVAVLSEDHHA